MKSETYEGLRLRFGNRIAHLWRVSFICYRIMQVLVFTASPLIFYGRTHLEVGIVAVVEAVVAYCFAFVRLRCLKAWGNDMDQIGIKLGDIDIRKQINVFKPKFENFDGWCKENNIDPFSINNSRPL